MFRLNVLEILCRHIGYQPHLGVFLGDMKVFDFGWSHGTMVGQKHIIPGRKETNIIQLQLSLDNSGHTLW
jgi:hypothetical protein